MFDYITDKCALLMDMGIWHKMDYAEKDALMTCTTEIQADNQVRALIKKYL